MPFKTWRNKRDNQAVSSKLFGKENHLNIKVHSRNWWLENPNDKNTVAMPKKGLKTETDLHTIPLTTIEHKFNMANVSAVRWFMPKEIYSREYGKQWASED